MDLGRGWGDQERRKGGKGGRNGLARLAVQRKSQNKPRKPFRMADSPAPRPVPRLVFEMSGKMNQIN